MRPKEIISSEKKKKIITKEKKISASPADNPKVKNSVIAIIIIATVAVSTFALNKFLGTDVLESDWYWIIIGATAIICLVGWMQKKIQIESAKVVCIIVLCLALPMLIVNTLWPGTTLPELKKKLSTAPAPVAKTQPQKTYAGKVLVVKLQPHERYTIDKVTQKTRWRYLSFNGAFSHRVDEGDGKACWKLVDNNLPWNADWSGELQAKAGNSPVKLTVNIY